MKNGLVVLGLFSLLVVIMNSTALPVQVGLEPAVAVYTYETPDGQELLEAPGKGTVLDFSQTPCKRKFKKNYLKFWKWGAYLTEARWQLAYYQ